MRWILRLCLVGMALCASPAFAQRVALVVGESAYRTVSPLANPGADANLVSNALARAGFDVRLGLDLDKRGLDTALDDFAHDAQQADVALVYFAGHGFESGGRNWLVPVDAAIRNADDVPGATVPFEAVARALAGAKIKVVALDACRNNPFAARVAEGGVINRGLGEVELDGYVIVYAASAGAFALDGGTNSPFAQSFARWVSEPNVDLRLLAGRIRDDVMATTGGQQRPFVSASLSGEATVLSPAAAGHVRGAASARERPSAYFEFVRKVDDPGCFQTQTIKCVTRTFDLAGQRLVTFEDDNKVRTWDPAGAGLQRAVAVPAHTSYALWENGPTLISTDEASFTAIFTPHDVRLTPLDGARPTTGTLSHFSDAEGDPVLRMAVGASPRAVFSYPGACRLAVFDLRTFVAVGTNKGASWSDACGEGKVDWVFDNKAGTLVIASVANQFRGDTTAEALLLSIQTGAYVCHVPGVAVDAAFNETGGFHIARDDGSVIAYDGQCRAVRTDRLHRALVTEVYPFDRDHMMSRSVDGVLKVWTAARGVVDRELTGLPRGARVQFVRGANGVLILNEDKRLYLWTGEPRLGAYVGPSVPVCGGAISEDANTLYALRCDGALEVWRRRAS